ETSFASLREACLAAKAGADPDPEATHRRIHAGRGLRFWTDGEGAGNFSGRGVPEDVAGLRSVLEPTREELFGAARRAGQVVASDALDYDALLATLRRALGEPTDLPAGIARQTTDLPDSGRLANPAGPRRSRRPWSRATVIVRVDATAAARGHAVSGEVCEIVGTGPVPVGTVRAMLADGAGLAVVSTRGDAVETVAHVRADRAAGIDPGDADALAAELARTGRPVSGVVHPGRAPSRAQLTALHWLQPTCAVTGCVNPRCDVDHRTGWAVTKTTRLEDLDPLCRFHHNLKTHRGWALVDGEGARPIVPPEDERHPRHRRAG
ncbi:MAG: HNH endonuclease signature motif containing protein, partial [Mycobacteriales bacterium]|nr:HNH endonuclease [Frankia sp.]